MNHTLGKKLKIRAMVHVAGEAIPFFWPMRTFIHHNPLYGLEHLPFHEAIKEGRRLFHGRGYLPRAMYQQYLGEGKIDQERFSEQVAQFLGGQPRIPGVDGHSMLLALATKVPISVDATGVSGAELRAAWMDQPLSPQEVNLETLKGSIKAEIHAKKSVYALVDELYGTHIGNELNELLIKSCLDFFDEGQSVWQMPGREKGLFRAWSTLASSNLRLFIRGLQLKKILSVDETPEGVISHVMQEWGIPEDDWMDYFTRELTQLHGWAGFIRWRSSAKDYHWGRSYPADLVDYLAIRLVLGLALLNEHAQRKGTPASLRGIEKLAEEQPGEYFLRHAFYRGQVVPELAAEVEDVLSRNSAQRINRFLPKYLTLKREHEVRLAANRLMEIGNLLGTRQQLLDLDPAQLDQLLALLTAFEVEEGQMWLNALESNYMHGLKAGLSLEDGAQRTRRPFAQMLFCIDVRSERIRRHLEKVGDYQTFGIAGFFGIPVGFIGLDKGSETQLCPVVVSPKNLVLELDIVRGPDDQAFLSVLEQVFHELKASVLSPFITVEAIGLLFGVDMFGKSLAPLAYNRWRQRLRPEKQESRLLLDKLSRDQAESIIRSLQRAMIVKAIGREFGIQREAITDDMIGELRDAALGNWAGSVTRFASSFQLGDSAEKSLVARLQNVYRINRGYTQIQLERLGRIGFTLDEQVHFVSQALGSIGLTRNFSRFILVAGHGSTSENNPYESALDCGACGGNHGTINARVLSQMANKPAVRERLRIQGIEIQDDAWFIPAFHNTTTDELLLYDLDLLPSSHLVHLERLNIGLRAASRLCAAERVRTLGGSERVELPAKAYRHAQRNAMDWSQVRPEWGLSRNAAFLIGRRSLTEPMNLDGRVFLHSYDYRCDLKGRLLENILTGPLVVGQWINMEHYFSTVDNVHYGSGSKVYHNVAGRFGVMTGNLSDLRTGLPAQTVLKEGLPYHEPMRLLTIIEAPLTRAKRAIEGVVKVRNLVYKGWVRMAIIDPETHLFHLFQEGTWLQFDLRATNRNETEQEVNA